MVAFSAATSNSRAASAAFPLLQAMRACVYANSAGRVVSLLCARSRVAPAMSPSEARSARTMAKRRSSGAPTSICISCARAAFVSRRLR